MNLIAANSASDIISAHCRDPELCAIRQKAVLTLCRRGVQFDTATSLVDSAIVSDVVDDAVLLGTLIDEPAFERTLEMAIACVEVDAVIIGRLLAEQDTTIAD